MSAGQEGNVYCWPTGKEGRIDVVSGNNRSSAVYGLVVDCPSLLYRKVKRKEDTKQVIEDIFSLVISTGDGALKCPPWNLEMLHSPSAVPADTPSPVILPDSRYVHITVLKLSYDRHFLFAGTSTGSLRIYSWPAIVTAEYPSGYYIEIPSHDGAIVSLHESLYSNTLITTGIDGNIILYEFERAMFPKIPIPEAVAGTIYIL